MNVFYIVLAGIWGIGAIVNGIIAGVWISIKGYGVASLFGGLSLLNILLVVLYSIMATGVEL